MASGKQIFILILAILAILPLCRAEIEMACLGDKYYDGDLSNGECIKTQRIAEAIPEHAILVTGDGSKINDSAFRLFSGKIMDTDRQNSVEIFGESPHVIEITSGLDKQEGKPYIGIGAEDLINFIIYDYDINTGIKIDYSAEENKLQLTQANWTNSSQILRALAIENIPSCGQKIVIGNNLNLYLDDDCELNDTVIRSKVLLGFARLFFKNCTTRAEELYLSKGVLSVKKSYTECNNRAVAEMGMGSLSLPSIIDGDMMLIVKGENITMRGGYKQKGIIAYSTASNRMKILDGSLEIGAGAEIKGKNIYVFHDFGDLANFEQGASAINGRTMDLRKTDGIKNNAVFIGEEGLKLAIAKNSSFDLVFDSKQTISVKDGVTESMSPSSASWRDFSVGYTNGKIIANCDKGACEYESGGGERVDIALTPYFEGKLRNEVRTFYSEGAYSKVTTTFKPAKLKSYVLGAYNPLSWKTEVKYSEFRKSEQETSIHEFAHAIWQQSLPGPEAASFASDVIDYLDHPQPEKLEKDRKTIAEDLGPYHGFGSQNGWQMITESVSRPLKFLGYWPGKLMLRENSMIDSVEGWAWISGAIYNNCKGISEHKFPDEILRHYEGIVSNECLEKAKA